MNSGLPKKNIHDFEEESGKNGVKLSLQRKLIYMQLHMHGR